jgi:hypothetical protein
MGLRGDVIRDVCKFNAPNGSLALGIGSYTGIAPLPWRVMAAPVCAVMRHQPAAAGRWHDLSANLRVHPYRWDCERFRSIRQWAREEEGRGNADCRLELAD